MVLALAPAVARADCAAPSAPAGGLHYFPGDDFKYCDGTNWIGWGGGGGGSASGADGAIQFNDSSAFGSASTFVYKSATGRLGIGTGTPTQRLTVNGNIEVPSGKTIGTLDSFAVNDASAGYIDIGIKPSGADTRFGGVRVSRTSAGGSNSKDIVQFFTDQEGLAFSTEKMRIEGNGNVGVGTSSPTQKLTVSGNIEIPSGTTIGTLDSFAFNDAIAGHIDVGIKPSGADTRFGGMRVSRISAGGSNSQDIVQFFTDQESLAFSTERMRILGNGNIGIGTFAPGALLHLDTTFAGASTKGLIIQGATSQIASLTEWQNSSGTALAFVNSSGWVNAPKYCDENGTNCFTAAGSSGGGGSASGTDGAIQFNNSSALEGASTFVYKSATGRVGIGTTNPGTQLTLYQASGASKGFLLSGREYYDNNYSDADGVLLLLGVNRIGNRQLWIGDNTALGSSTNGFFRYGTGTPLPTIDAVTGNGVTRLPVNIGTPTSNVAIGYEYGATTGGVLPGSRLSVYGNVAIGVGNHGAAAPTDGLIVKGQTGIGTQTPGAQLQVNPSSTATKGLIVQGYASQTANLQEWQNSSGTALAVVSSAGSLGIGKSNPTVALDVVGDVNYTGTIADVSDRRLKDNIKPLRSQLAKITTLQGVSFDMKADKSHELGLIAQDVEPVYPELVKTLPDGTKTLNYVGLMAPLIETIKEQQRQIDEQRRQVERLQAENRGLAKRLTTLEGRHSAPAH